MAGFRMTNTLSRSLFGFCVYAACVGGIGLFGIGAVGSQVRDSVWGQATDEDDYFAEDREYLIEMVLKRGGVKNEDVLKSIAETPRHEFVPRELRDEAYADRALPIGEGQTISSPYIVALMTEALKPKKTDKVLEIGTGSGYQAAVLSPLVRNVYTIEIVEELGNATARLLKRLRYDNIQTKVGDGFLGWPEHAPFDKIIVTCSPDKVPQPLVDQLKEGGLMAIPVGPRYQQLLYVFKKEQGKLVAQYRRPTLFVPMTGQAEEVREDEVDPANPVLFNGDFEAPPLGDYIPYWYYEFNAKLSRDPKAPAGPQVVEFTNDERGAPSMLLQGMPLDGRVVTRIRLSGSVFTSSVVPGATVQEQPMVVLQLMDENRNQIGYYFLGPYTGNRRWKRDTRVFPVPIATREAIVQIGLFGATGTVKFDDISIEAVGRR